MNHEELDPEYLSREHNPEREAIELSRLKRWVSRLLGDGDHS